MDVCVLLLASPSQEKRQSYIKVQPGKELRGWGLRQVDPSQLFLVCLFVCLGLIWLWGFEKGFHYVAQVKLIAQLSCPGWLGVRRHEEAWRAVGPRLLSILRVLRRHQLPWHCSTETVTTDRQHWHSVVGPDSLTELSLSTEQKTLHYRKGSLYTFLPSFFSFFCSFLISRNSSSSPSG